MNPILGIVASQITGHLNVPPPVSGYSLWLDASDTSTITSSSGAVSNWLDKSTNAYNFAQSTSTYKPTTGTRTINSKNVIDFDGTNDFLESTAASSVWKYLHNTATTWFVVGILDNSSANVWFGDQAGSTSRIGVYAYNTGTTFLAACDRGVSASGVYSGATTDTYSTSPVYVTYKSDPTNATAANRIKIAKNAGSFQGSNTATAAASSSDPENTMFLGTLYDTGTYGPFLNGVIGEIIFYPSLLSAGDITSVQGYLAAKWGI
jgi:hypothetical protein